MKKWCPWTVWLERSWLHRCHFKKSLNTSGWEWVCNIRFFAISSIFRASIKRQFVAAKIIKNHLPIVRFTKLPKLFVSIVKIIAKNTVQMFRALLFVTVILVSYNSVNCVGYQQQPKWNQFNLLFCIDFPLKSINLDELFLKQDAEAQIRQSTDMVRAVCQPKHKQSDGKTEINQWNLEFQIPKAVSWRN